MQPLPRIIQNANHVTHPTLNAAALDPDKILPLELIREHTKTDDVMSVSDNQLQLYRAAAFEMAERYTGLSLAKQSTITQDCSPPVRFTKRRFTQEGVGHTYKVELLTPVANNEVWFYGRKNGRPVRIEVKPGTKTVYVPWSNDSFGMDCCREDNYDISRLMYVGGIACENSVPALMKMGALKLITHYIENPGDYGSEDAMWKSGALESWRMLDNEA